MIETCIIHLIAWSLSNPIWVKTTLLLITSLLTWATQLFHPLTIGWNGVNEYMASHVKQAQNPMFILTVVPCWWFVTCPRATIEHRKEGTTQLEIPFACGCQWWILVSPSGAISWWSLGHSWEGWTPCSRWQSPWPVLTRSSDWPSYELIQLYITSFPLIFSAGTSANCLRSPQADLLEHIPTTMSHHSITSFQPILQYSK